MKLSLGSIPLVAVVAAACSVLEPQADPTRFYVLSPSVQQAGAALAAPVHVVVGPVVLPDYLNRPQVVTRTAPSRIDIAEFDRWAEPLPTAFARVLGQNLRASLGHDAVGRFPWAPADSGYQLEIDVLRFEPTGDGAAELAARWTLRHGDTKRVLLSRESTVKRAAESNDTPAAVAALSACLGDFSAEVAQALIALQTER